MRRADTFELVFYDSHEKQQNKKKSFPHNVHVD